MSYRCVTTLSEIQNYLGDSGLISFDYETSPDEAFRDTPKAALDPHRSHIVGVSFSVAEGEGIYAPLAHRAGKNSEAPDGIWRWLDAAFFSNTSIVKIAHNLSFEAMFTYAKSVVILPPVYDTIAASQMTLKSNTKFRVLGDSDLKALVELCGVELPGWVTDGRHFDSECTGSRQFAMPALIRILPCALYPQIQRVV